ncbi:NADP-dependent oxidoreductase [Actinosynnema sp. NPDC020468]|uniref:MDR family NADP-dependent oxidoreductase n=1 Tax=Actinosynnema sp. NPDC020468 TaxID=3154488 RepID=UPI0033F5F8F2
MKIEKWVVREHLPGLPDVDRIYEKVVEDVDVRLAPDEMLLETLFVSVDPYQQGLALDTPLGDHMGADSVMRVLESGPDAAHRPGEVVQGFGGWRSHVIATGGPQPWRSTWHTAENAPLVFPAYRPLDPAGYDDALPLYTAISVLGGPGMTAWGAMTKALTVRPGHEVLVSGASGAVGTLAGQLARRAGGRVVGTTAYPEKADHLRSLGFDDVLVYRPGDRPEDVRAALEKAFPTGVDRYLDTVGGALTDEVFGMLAIEAEVAVCAQFETQAGGDPLGPRLLPMLMRPRATVRGIFSVAWMEDPVCWAELERDLGDLVRSGELVYDHTIHYGFDAIPTAYRSLFADRAGKRGKVLVEL